MSFFTPAAGALVALAALIVVQYILKLRRPVLPVASTFLWERALEDTRANAPWQRLRPDRLLLLQLLALLALVGALMRPYVLHAGSVNQNVVAVLDASLASRSAEGGSSRFDQERARLRDLIANLPPGNTMSVIRMDSHPRVLVAGSSDHGLLDSVLAAQQPGYDAPDARASMSLAAGLAGGRNANTQIRVFRAVTTQLPPLQGTVSVVDEPSGDAAAPNLGIAAFAAALQPDGTVATLVRILNTGRTTLSTDLEVRADGKLEDLQTVRVAPGDSQSVESLGLPRAAGSYQAHLALSDALAADNTAWTTLASQPPTRVLLVTPGNLFLRVILQTAASVALRETTPQAYTPDMATGTDLVIFDQWLPATLPTTNLLAIAPPGNVLDVEAGAQRNVGTPQLDDDPAALLRYMTVSNIHIQHAVTLRAPGWAHVAMRDQAGPLLLEAEHVPQQNVGRLAVLAFNLEQSDLPLSLDFPIFITNLLHWLAPGLTLDNGDLRPAQVVRIGVPAGTNSATVTQPDGHPVSLLAGGAATGGAVPFADTGTPGLYTIDEQAGTRHLRATFTVNTGSVLSAPAAASTSLSNPARAPKAASAGKVPLELTDLLVVAVLAVLAGEWYIAMRRR